MNPRRVILCVCFVVLLAAGAVPSLADAAQPVLTLKRQSNFYEEGARSGTLIELYDDLSLNIYALGLLNDPVLMFAGTVSRGEYDAALQVLNDGGFWELPEWIDTGVLDGDTVTLTAATDRGTHTVAAYSPDGTPYGDIFAGIWALFGGYENAVGE